MVREKNAEIPAFLELQLQRDGIELEVSSGQSIEGEAQVPCLQYEAATSGSAVNRRVVRIKPDELNLNFSTSRYLIDFITNISDASSGLAHLTVTPAWTRTLDNVSNPTSIPQTNRHWSTIGANFRMADDPAFRQVFRALLLRFVCWNGGQIGVVGINDTLPLPSAVPGR
jgi:hypothetical protein